MSGELLIGIASFLLTFMVLSYLVGDNPAFRFAVYLFIGASAGYAAAVAWWQVIWPRLADPIIKGSFGERAFALVALLLSVLLLMKLSSHTSRLGNIPIAFLVGVGAAVALGGALTGTLFPQVSASVNIPTYSQIASDVTITGPYHERFAFGLLSIFGTATTLIYFHFGAKSTPAGPRRSKLLTVLGWVGQVFIAITLGVLFAGVFSASLAALIKQTSSMIDIIKTILGKSAP